MTGFSIAVIIVGLLIFAELYSIREILNRQHDKSEYVQTVESKLKSLQIDLNEQSEALNELIEMIEDNKTLLSTNGQNFSEEFCELLNTIQGFLRT